MRKQEKKKKQNFSKNKRAFDSVLRRFRRLKTVGGLSATNISGGSPTSPNPTKPSPLDFRSDVDLVVTKILAHSVISRIKFGYAYLWFDSENVIEQEKFAERLLGSARHSVEQRMGAEFVRRGLFPVQNKGYFYSLRRSRNEK